MAPESPCQAEDNLSQLSKNQAKKLRRQQEWDAKAPERRARRKEKVLLRRQKRREQNLPCTDQENQNGNTSQLSCIGLIGRRNPPLRLPICVVIDCSYDDLMKESEIKSLASQITRCYSDNQKLGPFQVSLIISAWSGRLKNRFETILSSQHLSWKSVQFYTESLEQLINQSMLPFPPAFEYCVPFDQPKLNLPNGFKGKLNQPETRILRDNTIYLTGDSPCVLNELKPFHTYIIGGLVDRNRHKGICFNRAQASCISTAKLPINDYLHLTAPAILTTTHVLAILLRWLESQDWSYAFLESLPKRKGAIPLNGGSIDVSNVNTENPEVA